MRNYECLIIIASNKSEDATQKLITKFSEMASNKTKVEKWGMKKLATPINYRKEGFYVLLNFAATTDTVAKMTKLMNITDGIERYMFIEKDDKMIAADAARKARKAAAREAKTEEQTGE